MGIFKIWGEEDIVRDVEDFGGTVEYNHIESYVGDDELTAPDLSRPVRNLFENQNWIYQYLESVADMHEDSYGVYRNSLENAMKVDDSTDFVALPVNGSFETTTIAFNSAITLSDLNSEYFTINDGNDNAYYVWFNYNSTGSDPTPGGTGVEIAILTTDDIDDVIITITNELNTLGGYTIFNATPNYVTNTITVLTTILGNVTDSTQGTVDAGDIVITPISGSATYKKYVRIPPGVARVGDTIFANIPQTWIAERQLERILGLETDEGTPEYVTITYDYTNDKYQARIYTKNSTTGVVDYDEFVNGGTWGTPADGYDTGAELIHAIFQNTKFTSAMYNGLGGYNYDRITLEPTLEISDTGTGVVRYIYIDSTTLDFTWDSSAGTGTDLNLFTVDFDADATSITINTLTDTRTFFQRNVDYNQDLFLNVPRTISGESGDPGTEDLGSLDFTKVTNQDVTIKVLRQNAGSDDSSYIMWDESEGNFDSNRDLLIRENLVPVPRGNNQIATTNTINENIDTLDAAIGGTIIPVVRFDHPIIDTNTINANLSALDAAIGITPVPVTTRTNNPIVDNNTVIENLEALDAAVGIDVTPQSRTNNPLVVDTSVNTKLDTLDAAIGADISAPSDRNASYELVIDTSVNAKLSVIDDAIGATTAPWGATTRTFVNGNLDSGNSVNTNINALNLAIGGDPGPVTRLNNPIDNNTTINANISFLDAAIGSTPTSLTYIANNQTVNQNLSALDFELANLGAIASARTAGDAGTGFVRYAGTTLTAGQLYGGTTNPSGSTRLNYAGYLYATAFYATSTREAKDNITDFSGSALDILNSTEIKAYNYKGDDQQKIGFIAEDTNPLLSTEKQTNFDMTNTIGVLIKAVQELSAEVAELKGAIA